MSNPSPDQIASEAAENKGYQHPTLIAEFEHIYRQEYKQELESCDSTIKWCEKRDDGYGINFHQGMRAAHVFNNIKMEQLLRVLKQEAPNINAELSALRSASLADKAEIARLRHDRDLTMADTLGKSIIAGKLLDDCRVENQRLREVLASMPVGHTRSCTFNINGDSPETDYCCTCGLAERRAIVAAALSDSTPSEQCEEQP